jgi:Mg-chelatase subunit ChlD
MKKHFQISPSATQKIPVMASIKIAEDVGSTTDYSATKSSCDMIFVIDRSGSMSG